MFALYNNQFFWLVRVAVYDNTMCMFIIKLYKSTE